MTPTPAWSPVPMAPEEAEGVGAHADDDAPRRPLFVPLGGMALLWIVLIDIPDALQLGPLSGGALLTIATALVCLCVLGVLSMARPVPNEALEPRLESARRRVPLPLILFALWATCSALVHTSVAGAQNVLVYDTFVGAVIACASFTSAGSAGRYLPRVALGAWFVAVVYLLSVARDGLGAESVYGPRSVALEGLVLLAVGVSTRRRLLTVVTVLMIGSTVSRTATVLAIGLLFLGVALNSRRTARLGRILVWSVVAVAAIAFAVTRIAPLRDRFFGGDAAFQFHGISYNTSGRTQLWSYTWNLAHEHLLFGGGPGNAQIAVTARFGISHPHNDYLRLLNDLGVVGLVLFVLGLLALLRGTWVRGRETGQPIHWAAFLGLLGVAGSAVTDNALVYPFVMVPLGVIVGLSLAHPVAEKRPEPASADETRPWLGTPATEGDEPGPALPSGASEPAARDRDPGPPSARDDLG